MIKYQSKILIFETSELICPDDNICVYRINQVVFTLLVWGLEEASDAPPTELPHYVGVGEAIPTGKPEEAQVSPVAVNLFQTIKGPRFVRQKKGIAKSIQQTLCRVWPRCP